MNKFEALGRHYFDEVLHPSLDSKVWLAYLVLNKVYPSLGYWSYDGYHVDALVDYERNLLWEDNLITSTDRKIIFAEVPYLSCITTTEIVKVWEIVVKKQLREVP